MKIKIDTSVPEDVAVSIRKLAEEENRSFCAMIRILLIEALRTRLQNHN